VGQSIKVGCKFAFSLQTKDLEPGAPLVRVCEKEHVDANGQQAHPKRMCPNLSNVSKDWVYERRLSGPNPAGTSITGTVFSYTVCSCLVANAAAAGRNVLGHNASATPVPCLAPVSLLVAQDVWPAWRRSGQSLK
jgi:hypothetical protein